MTRRALLIGSATHGLTGTGADLDRMQQVLSAFDFTVDVRSGPRATRAGILEGWESLIGATMRGDLALFYYTGHGALAPNPGAGTPGGGPRAFQSIVPTDIDASTEDDFRGILGLELSGLLARLGERTDNAVAILDCCHATGLCRDGRGVRPKALEQPLQTGLLAHLGKLRAAGVRLGCAGIDGNPGCVVVAACGAEESAWEIQTPSGATCGALTDALAAALSEASGAAITWEALGRRVRDRVAAILPWQRPEAIGPVRRVLFSTEEIAEDGSLGVVLRDGRAALSAGRLFDVRPGDLFAIRPVSEALPTDAPLAMATVQSVGASESPVSLDPPGASIPAGARAVLARRAASRAPIAVAGTGDARERLSRAVESCPLTRVAAEGESPAGSLALSGDDVEARDRDGNLLFSPRPFAAAQAAIAGALRSLARAQWLRKLWSGPSPTFDADAFSVTWGVVEQGEARPLPLSGARLRAGQRLFVTLSSRAPATLYFHVFEIGVDQAVSSLTRSRPSGVDLAPGSRPFVVGEDDLGDLQGLPASWPAQVPIPGGGADPARGASLVVVVCDAPQDLRPAETATLPTAALPTAAVREGAPQARPVSYRTLHIDFLLTP